MENNENDQVKASYEEVNSMSKYDCMSFVEKNEALLETLKKQLSGDNKVVQALEKMCRFLEQNGMNVDQADFQEESKGKKNDKKRDALDYLGLAIYKFLCLAIKLVGHTGNLGGKTISWLGKMIVKFGDKLDGLVDESGELTDGEKLLENFVEDFEEDAVEPEVEIDERVPTDEEISDVDGDAEHSVNLEEDADKINYWATLCDQEDL